MAKINEVVKASLKLPRDGLSMHGEWQRANWLRDFGRRPENNFTRVELVGDPVFNLSNPTATPTHFRWMNCPGFPESSLCEYTRGELSRLSAMKLLLVLRRGNIPDRFQQPLWVEQGDPLKRRVLDVIQPAPWALVVK